jgi:hypothetical protein
MGVKTKRYIRKPLYVEAVRVTTDNFEEIAAWCDGKIQEGEAPPGSGKRKKYIRVLVQNPKNPRQTMAFVGDWLLCQNGNYKIYTNKAFKLAFDLDTEKPELVSEHNAREAKAQEKRSDLPPQPRHVGGNIEIQDRRVHPEAATDSVPTREGEKALVEGTKAAIKDHLPSESPEMKQARESIEADGGTVEPATPEAIAEVIEEQESVKEGRVDPEAIAAAMQEQPVQPVDEGIAVSDSPTAPPVQGEEKMVPVDPSLLEDHVPIEAAIPEPVIPPEVAPQPEAVSEQSPEVAAAGKRVLSEHEQKVLGPDEVRQMVQSGDVILAQDLAEQA